MVFMGDFFYHSKQTEISHYKLQQMYEINRAARFQLTVNVLGQSPCRYHIVELYGFSACAFGVWGEVVCFLNSE